MCMPVHFRAIYEDQKKKKSWKIWKQSQMKMFSLQFWMKMFNILTVYDGYALGQFFFPHSLDFLKKTPTFIPS